MQEQTMQKGITFDRKYLIALVLPLIGEQILAVTVGMADMIMVSGAVVAAQALGAQKKEVADKVANQLILVCLMAAGIITALSIGFNRGILKLIYGSVERGVMDNAVTYFYITAFSFPFIAVYYGATALFRSMGKSNLSLYVSAVMNILNIIGNAILVYGFHMGIAGVGYSTLASRAVACVIVVFLLRNEKYELHIDKYFRFGFEPRILGKILKIGIPSGIDSAMFQIGKLFTQSLITSFGTASIAANATASTIELLATIPAAAMGLALTTVVGQCVGAEQYDTAMSYTKKLMRWAYLMLWGLNIVIVVIAPVIASWYNLTAEGNRLAIELIRYHSICCMIMWPAAWTLESVLRAAGDVKFVLISSIVTMWIFRIALSYVIGGFLGLGVLGVWVAMTIDWLVRCILNIWRLKSGRWKRGAVV